MKLIETAAVTALSLVLGSGAAQISTVTPFTDPANLRGERVAPRDGRELPIDQGAPGLQQVLRRLNTRASLMLIVAHPDDEDGGMLTYYSRGLGARVAMLTLNRGEGGQNAMTGDFEDALGLLRTQELLAADRYMGVDQMFGTEVDFGFSKTKEEAFSKWTHERVLYDAVRAVRLYRPMVIASVFIGGVTDGHGQHQVAGEITQEVFKAAGDPNIFPELTAEGILPWQPLKVYARVPLGAVTDRGLFDYATGQYTPARFVNYVTGEVTTTIPSSDVVVQEGTTDSLLTRAGANAMDLSPALASKPADTPLSYVQFARIGLGLQKSQIGPGLRNPPAGAFNVAYHLYGTASGAEAGKNRSGHDRMDHVPAALGFFDGLSTSLLSLQDVDPGDFPTGLLADASRALERAQEIFDPRRPGDVATLLAQAGGDFDRLIASLETGTHQDKVARANALHELRVKRAQVNDALVLALGLDVEATAKSATGDAYTGAELPVSLHAAKRTAEDVNAAAVRLENFCGSQDHGEVLASTTPPWVTKNVSWTLGALPADEVITPVRNFGGMMDCVTEPYFSRSSIEQPFYDLSKPVLRNAPASPPGLTAWVTFRYAGFDVRVGRVVHDGAQPIRLVPPINVALTPHAQVFPSTADEFTVVLTDRSDHERKSSNWSYGFGSLEVPNGYTLRHGKPDATQQETLVVSATGATPRAGFTVDVSGGAAGGVSNRMIVGATGYRPVGYGDLPRTNFYTPATDRIVPVDLNLPTHRRIAYLTGTGDAVPESLASIGLQPAMLTIADLTPAKLAQFDTVVLGVRTYSAHPELHGAPTQALLDYVRNGGNVIVQYQTAEFTGEDAPFPLTLGNAEKVVDENAPVHLLMPETPVLRTPNHLNETDFSGWIEERGHGFLRSWDDRYSTPTETHDPGSLSEGVAPQTPQRGGLVTVPLGKGHWTYCAFALYRQLPEAVPGAYRLLGNLLALADER